MNLKVNDINRQIATQAGPVIQLDQKKVPVFHGEPSKDTLTVQEWAKRIDGMRQGQDWTDEQTYHNAYASLFGDAAQIMNLICGIPENNHATTWTWLKPQMLKTFGQMKGNRAIIDILMNMRPSTSHEENIMRKQADVFEQFRKIQDSIKVPEAPAAGNYTEAQVHTMIKQARKDLVNEFCMVYLINMIHPDFRVKLMEKDPNTINEVVTYSEQIWTHYQDRKRPIGKVPNAINTVECQETDEFVIEYAARRGLFNRPNQNQGQYRQQQSDNSKNRGKGRKSSNSNDKEKKCSYCNKKNHGAIECRSRIANGDPCLSATGEAFYPKTDGDRTKINDTGKGYQPMQQVSSVHIPTKNSPAPKDGPAPKDFQYWV